METKRPKGEEERLPHFTCELCFERFEALAYLLPAIRGAHRREVHGLKSGDHSRGHVTRRGKIYKSLFHPGKG